MSTANKSISICSATEPVHIWKGFVPELDCSLSVYLIADKDEPKLQSLLVLCDYSELYYTEWSIDRMTLVFTTEELQLHINEGTVINIIVQEYLKEESLTRQTYGLTLH